MGKCSFCGKDAGFLRGFHRECKQSQRIAKKEILGLIIRQGTDPEGFKYLAKEIDKMASSSYIGPKAFAKLLIEGWERVVKSKFKQDGLSKNELMDLYELAERLGIPVPSLQKSKLLIEGWERVANSTLNQNALDEKDLSDLYVLAVRLGIPVSKLQNRNVFPVIEFAREQIRKNAFLSELKLGTIPTYQRGHLHHPFNLQSGESLVWVFDYAECLEWTETYPATIDTYSGKLYEAKYNWVSLGIGQIGVTDRHIYFSGHAVLRHSFDMVIAFEPTSDGILLRFDPLINFPVLRYITGDNTFTYSLVSILAQM